MCYTEFMVTKDDLVKIVEDKHVLVFDVDDVHVQVNYLNTLGVLSGSITDSDAEAVLDEVFAEINPDDGVGLRNLRLKVIEKVKAGTLTVI